MYVIGNPESAVSTHLVQQLIRELPCSQLLASYVLTQLPNLCSKVRYCGIVCGI